MLHRCERYPRETKGDTMMPRTMRSRTMISALLTSASVPPATYLASRRTVLLAQILLVVLYLLLSRLVGAPLPLPARGSGCQGVQFPC